MKFGEFSAILEKGDFEHRNRRLEIVIKVPLLLMNQHYQGNNELKPNSIKIEAFCYFSMNSTTVSDCFRNNLFLMGEFLFKIQETVRLENVGLLVTADVKFEDARLKIGDEIELRPPGGAPFETRVAGIAMFNPYDPERLFTFSLPLVIDKHTVSVDTEVWSRS